MAIKFLMFTLFFSLVVILPVQVHYTGEYGWHHHDNGTDDAQSYVYIPKPTVLDQGSSMLATDGDGMGIPRTGFLWVYVVFVYLFSGFAMYLITTETIKIIRIRQDLLGSQSTITDRTIRLSGIPSNLRSEEKIKEFLEDLGIGKVESVMVCRNWKELDDLLERRMSVLRKLEEAWTVHLGHRRVERNLESLPIAQPAPPGPIIDRDDDDEQGRLLDGDDTEQSHVTPYSRDRPKTRIWYGFLNLQSRTVDAIDYYEEKLRKLDDQIKMVRKKDFEPTPFAFVTMDTTASCVSTCFVYEMPFDGLTLCSKWQYKRYSTRRQCSYSQNSLQRPRMSFGKILIYPAETGCSALGRSPRLSCCLPSSGLRY